MNTEEKMNSHEIAKMLAEPFPEEMEKVIVKSGVQLVYLPISEVINRLNKVLGVDGWSFEILSVRRDEVDVDELVAHVVLTAEINGKQVTKHGFGGQSVKRQRKDNKPVDLGNDFKGAVSDALKKAAQQLGIGLYLARSTDAMDAEEAMNGSEQQAPVVQQNNELDEQWNNFVEITRAMSKEQKDSLNAFWEAHSGGKPKPTKSTATKEDIESLVVEALKIQFSGSKMMEENSGE
jgi:recombination DNA repair RAD52 pathway protein